MSEIIPKRVTAKTKSAVLAIEWSDGEVCEYPFSLLRNACPCAQCRGGHENMRSEPAADVFTIPLISADATRLKKVEMVGNYALNLEWADGHNYGIYEWHFLRVLCKRMKTEMQD